jgi:hypothetical protein
MAHKFDPSSDRWEYIWVSRGGQGGYLSELIELLFQHTKVSDRYSKAQVLDACVKCGYFGFGPNVIFYIPEEGESSLDYMGGQ